MNAYDSLMPRQWSVNGKRSYSNLMDITHRLLSLVALSSALCAPALAAESLWDKPLNVKFGGFLDTYYAYDFQRPPQRDRAFTTQPARHNEFNINLAFIDAVVQGERVRGRLALQAGTAVQSNYGGEPRVGAVSGPDLSRHIQEAVVGYKVTDKLWIDGGVYFSHIGLESWISRDNWTYTRSLIGDFSPYYQAGVKGSYQIDDAWSAQLHVLNGWQNISENNENKALGGQLAWTGRGWSVAYNNFWGQELQNDNSGRFFNDLVVKTPEFGKLQLAAAADYGIQKMHARGFSKWYGGSLIGRWKFNERVAAAARVERYADQDQVIVVTAAGQGPFETTAGSLNLDVALHKQLLWRTELRHFWGEHAVYPSRDASGFAKTDGVAVTSMALTF